MQRMPNSRSPDAAKRHIDLNDDVDGHAASKKVRLQPQYTWDGASSLSVEHLNCSIDSTISINLPAVTTEDANTNQPEDQMDTSGGETPYFLRQESMSSK